MNLAFADRDFYYGDPYFNKIVDSMSEDGWFDRLMQDTNPLYQLTDKGFEAFNKFNEIQQNCGSLKSLDIFRLWE